MLHNYAIKRTTSEDEPLRSISSTLDSAPLSRHIFLSFAPHLGRDLSETLTLAAVEKLWPTQMRIPRSQPGCCHYRRMYYSGAGTKVISTGFCITWNRIPFGQKFNRTESNYNKLDL